MDDEILHHTRLGVLCHVDQQGQRQRVVDDRLTHVENSHIVVSEDVHHRRCQPGPVASRQVDEEDIVHMHKVALPTTLSLPSGAG